MDDLNDKYGDVDYIYLLVDDNFELYDSEAYGDAAFAAGMADYDYYDYYDDNDEYEEDLI